MTSKVTSTPAVMPEAAEAAESPSSDVPFIPDVSLPRSCSRSVELAAAMSTGVMLMVVSATLVGGDVRVLVLLDVDVLLDVLVLLDVDVLLDVLVLLDVDVLLDVLVLLLVLVVVGHKPLPSVQSDAPLQAFPNRSVA